MLDFRAILIVLLLFSIGMVIFFFWYRWRKIKVQKEKMEQLKEDFKGKIDVKDEKPSPEDKKVLEKISNKIRESVNETKNYAEIDLKDGYNLKIISKDVLSLETPDTVLHKSFPKLRFEKTEKVKEKIKILFKNREN